MTHTLNIKGLTVNQAFKGRRFRTEKYDSFINKCNYLLPKSVIIEDEKNVKLAIEFGFSSRLSDIDNCCKTFREMLSRYLSLSLHYRKTVRDVVSALVLASQAQKSD